MLETLLGNFGEILGPDVAEVDPLLTSLSRIFGSPAESRVSSASKYFASLLRAFNVWVSSARVDR
jgi:hypothetical protein